jgi:hypothetical protein
MIAKVKEYDFDFINAKIQDLINCLEQQNNNSIVKQMKELIPEFKSNNSIYEKLD